MSDKIMAGVNLENIMSRLNRCCALLDAVIAGSTVSVEAVGGIRDLLKGICVDFQADIEGAEDTQID